MRKHHKRTLAGALALSLLALTGCSTKSVEPGMSVYVICKSNAPYWDTVKAGAMDAGEEMNLDVTYEAPASEDMIDEQISMIDAAITGGAKAIIVAPLDADQLNDVLSRAVDANVPILTIDSDVNFEGRNVCISTQNYSAGAIAARYAAKLVDSTGEVAVISHSETAQTALERCSGFSDALSGVSTVTMPGMGIPESQMPVGGVPDASTTDASTPETPSMPVQENAPVPEATTGAATAGRAMSDELGFPNMKIVETKNTNNDVEQARISAQQLIKEHPNLKVIYATNQAGTIGACQAIDEYDLANKVQLIGFDYFEGADNYLESGVLDAVIAQNPYNMGYLGVRYAKKIVDGDQIASAVDTGTTIITIDNLHDEDIQFLINPLAN